MTRHRDVLPPMLLGRARALGAVGERWLEGLDALTATLEDRWRVRVGPAMSGGSHAFAAPAEGADGARYVLKIELPDEDEAVFLQGAAALRAADGRGYARLFAVDAENRAVLLERLGGTLKSLGLPVARQQDILCAALAETWRIPAADAPLPGGAESVAWFRGFIPEAWRALERPCPRFAVDQALRLLDGRERRLPAAPRVLVHGDAHNNNLLQTPDGKGFKFIDPDGILYEPAYDLGVLMREWPEEYRKDPLAAGRARRDRLCRLTGADPEAVWAWGCLQSVSTGLILLRIGQTAAGREMLRTAEVWLRAGV